MPGPAAQAGQPPWVADKRTRRGAGGSSLLASLSGMREQTAWVPPPVCNHVAEMEAAGKGGGCGAESMEAPAMAADRAAGRWRPSATEEEGPGQRAAVETARVLPYWPASADEHREQVEVLRAGGWRPTTSV